MVPDTSPVTGLTKAPKPVPFVVLGSFVVGFSAMLQHTPRSVMVVPLPLEMVPPELAVASVIFVISAIVTVAKVLITSFLQLIIGDNSSPARRIEYIAGFVFMDVMVLG